MHDQRCSHRSCHFAIQNFVVALFNVNFDCINGSIESGHEIDEQITYICFNEYYNNIEIALNLNSHCFKAYWFQRNHYRNNDVIIMMPCIATLVCIVSMGVEGRLFHPQG